MPEACLPCNDIVYNGDGSQTCKKRGRKDNFYLADMVELELPRLLPKNLNETKVSSTIAHSTFAALGIVWG